MIRPDGSAGRAQMVRTQPCCIFATLLRGRTRCAAVTTNESASAFSGIAPHRKDATAEASRPTGDVRGILPNPSRSDHTNQATVPDD
jgi:hypothetical protein